MAKKITVIGGGPGGYVAALKGAIMGAEVTLIEKEKLGGTCLNKGCIPTKAFLKGIDVLDTVEGSFEFGITCENINADFKKIANRKNMVVNQLVGGIGYLLKMRGVKVLNGKGTLIASGAVKAELITGETIEVESDDVILAAGSVPVIPQMFKYDGKRVLTSDEILDLNELPASLIIVGGGVIGCEFGQFFAKMGTKVSIVEMANHILPNEDKDVASVISARLRRQGVDVLENIGVDEVEVHDECVVATLNNSSKISAEYMLISIGRKANNDNLVEEGLIIETQKGKITVNNKMQTSMKNVYAIGDLVDTPFLAHVASREAVVAIENIMGRESTSTYHAVPRCLYTHPEIGAVGKTEEQLLKEGIEYKKGIFRFAGIGKALVIGETEGFVKILVDKNDVLVGATIVGPQATDLLTELTMAVHLKLTAAQVGEIIHPHPTLSEALMEAVHDVHGESVHAF